MGISEKSRRTPGGRNRAADRTVINEPPVTSLWYYLKMTGKGVGCIRFPPGGSLRCSLSSLQVRGNSSSSLAYAPTGMISAAEVQF